ncbi:MAG: 4-hydroxy-2-oxovalerate aldolase (EC [uncultured Campylobacterales bacterium]|uniref:4-hydroxy-2-oxovalerate aldolase (EC) n=1 Tax=uncultured Campylobacterales bacterium TaxID=352960 RepID=A0A6S6SAT7_9BACT|nr:MAG: 4-hydroxy-2-oxovalerate aldolase (EC [uncultured Campylobacterales bacterium]
MGKGNWLESRKDIKILDCTIRDGGLINNYHFSDEFVKATYNACVDSGIEYMEIGKICSKTIMSEKEYGKFNFSEEKDIRAIVGENNTDLKLAVMADIGRTLKEEILPKKDSVIDMIRVATYIHQIPKALELIEDAHQKGYKTAINIMAISKVFESDLDDALKLLCDSNVDIIYLVDSFGSFYSEQIKELTNKYMKFAKDSGKEVGIHTHNNQQLAYANIIESLILGTSYLDTTICGMGRGAGNCPTELLMTFLKNPKYKLKPMLKFIEEYMVKMQKKENWGYSIPYMITGYLNEHPRSAIKFIDDNRTDFMKFDDELKNI